MKAEQDCQKQTTLKVFALLMIPQVLFCFAYRSWMGLGWAGVQLAVLSLGLCLGFGWTLGSRPRMFALVLCANALCLVFIGGYSNVFADLPSLYTLRQEFHEGKATTASWILYFPWFLLAILVPAYIGAWGLGRKVPAFAPRSLAVLGAMWCLLQLGVLTWPKGTEVHNSDSRRQIQGFWGASALDFWTAYRAADDSAMVQALLEDRLRNKPLTLGRATPLHRRVLVLQLESMDLQAIPHRFKGQWVTPFLRKLSETVAPLRLEPNHRGPSGSSGSDFQLLTGMRPLATKPAFSLNRMDWAQVGLAGRLHQKGYTTLVFHGNNGDYWSRRQALHAMKVDRFFELRDVMAVPDTHWGASDQALFAFMLKQLAATQGAVFAFGITMTSHTPFHYAPPGLTTEKDLLSRFFNSINYLDRSLETFLESLPGDEPWTVVLYGDHASRVQTKGYESLVEGQERVPLWIFSWEAHRATPVSFPDLASETHRSGKLEIASLFDFFAEQLPPGNKVLSDF